MSKKDSYITDSKDIPVWEKYEVMSFMSAQEMLKWVQNDKENFILSDRIYDAMIDCLETNREEVIVTTLSVLGFSEIDVLIRKPNFQKIFTGYIERLIILERYEKLAEIKQQIQKYNLEM